MLIGRLTGLPEEYDILEQYQEQVAEYKTELSGIRHYILSECPPSESDALMKSIVVDIEKLLFDMSLSLRKKTAKSPTSVTKPAPYPCSDCIFLSFSFEG